MSTMTTSDLRKMNKESILRYIYQQKNTYQQQICQDLKISRPTLIPILRECEEEGMIRKDGYYQSTGGRKANTIAFVGSHKITLGVELLIDSFEIVALDLYGETLASFRRQHPFSHDDEYYRTVCEAILTFIEEQKFSRSRILGVGIVLQGLISSDGDQVTYGKILNCTGLQVDAFTRYLPYPCKLFHDAEAAAEDELWQTPQLQNAIYMNIRSNVSGAIVVNRNFLKGTQLKSGVFEHMSLVPNGRPCYCGRKGCVDTYCSTQAFLDHAGSLEEFFQKFRSGAPDCVALWQEYLGYLASSINNLRMFIDYPIILGGTLAPFLEQNDLDALHSLVYNNTAFPTNAEFIRISRCTQSAISRGAALPYIKQYLASVMGE